MLYRRLGRTELNVSELGFGAARGYDQDDFPALLESRQAIKVCYWPWESA